MLVAAAFSVSSRLVDWFVYVFSDEQRCADSPGSSNSIDRECMLLLHKHKITNIK